MFRSYIYSSFSGGKNTQRLEIDLCMPCSVLKKWISKTITRQKHLWFAHIMYAKVTVPNTPFFGVEFISLKYTSIIIIIIMNIIKV
jgi:hypothetical protein